MGTRKKLTLASLVTLMVALSFVIGFVPAHDLGTIRAASEDGEFDMGGLLKSIMDTKAVQSIVPVLKVDATTVVSSPASLSVPLGLEAVVVGTGVNDVRYVANSAFPLLQPWREGAWRPDDFSPFAFSDQATDAPYAADLDIATFMTNTAQTIYIYALANTAGLAAGTGFMYESVNAEADRIELRVQTRDLDGDGNGYPDNITDIGPGELWITSTEQNGVPRTVVIANLSDPAKDGHNEVTVASGNTSVTGPDLATLQGVYGADGVEDAWLVVEAVDDLAGLVDEAGADTPSEWAEAVAAMAPGALTALAQYTEISLVYLYDGGASLGELDDLTGTGLSIEIAMTGLDIAPSDNPQVWSYPTDVLSDGEDGLRLAGNTAGEWVLKADAPTIVGETGLEMTTQTLSVFAPFNSGMQILGASPGKMFVGLEENVAINGVFPVSGLLSVAAASEAYAVYVGMQPIDESTDQVDFYAGGPGGAAITALAETNDMYVVVPNKSEAGMLSVRVVDLSNPANTAETADLIEVVDVYELTTDIQGQGSSDVSIDLLPTSSDPRLDEGTYEAGQSITATVSFPANELVFNGWALNGDSLGAGNPLSFAMPARASELYAGFSPMPTYTVTTNVVGSVGGATITLDPPSSEGLAMGEYYLGEEVTATVTFDDEADNFLMWLLDGVDNGTAVTTSFTVQGDHLLVAMFNETYARLMLTVGTGGSVDVIPPAGVDEDASGYYPQGTVLTLKAVADTGFAFDSWTGDDALDLVPDTATAEVTLTLDANKSITANFANVVIGVTGITPNEAWIFGGIVAEISGVGLAEDTVITIGETEVQGFRAAEDGTAIEVVIPPLTDTASVTGLPSIEADVTVTSADGSETATLQNGLTYKRYETAGGVSTTAFQIMTDAVADVDVTLQATNDNFATLHIPVLATAKPVGELVAGLARATDASAKQNTEALGTAFITDGEAVPSVRSFDIHFYTTTEAMKQTANTPAVGEAIFVPKAEYQNLPRFNEDGTLNDNPFTLTFPVTEADLTAGDVRKGLAMWGVETELDYVTNTLTSVGPVTELQSILLSNEVVPNLNASVADTEAITSVWMARLYTLQAYSLRMNAALPDEVVAAILAENPSGFFSGEQSGGWGLTVISSLGGLAWLDRVEFVNSTGQTVATATEDNFTTVPGTDEYVFDFSAPQSSETGIMDVTIYLKADPDTPAVTLPNFAEYTADGGIKWGVLLLALLIALIGLASGGSSGGGGGGPCFIATAAYGTPMAADIDALRTVRDSFMLDNAVGSAFVDAYYRVSPAIADAVAQSPLLAALVRVLLVPAIFLGKVAIAMPTLTAFVGISLGVAFMLRRRSRKA